jgi:hypothetical protein
VQIAFGDPIRPVDGESAREVTARVQEFFEQQDEPVDGSRKPTRELAAVGTSD